MSMTIDPCAKFGLSVHSHKSHKQPPLVTKKAVSDAVSAAFPREQLGTFGLGSAKAKSPIVNRPCKVPHDIGSEEESAISSNYLAPPLPSFFDAALVPVAPDSGGLMLGGNPFH